MCAVMNTSQDTPFVSPANKSTAKLWPSFGVYRPTPNQQVRYMLTPSKRSIARQWSPTSQWHNSSSPLLVMSSRFAMNLICLALTICATWLQVKWTPHHHYVRTHGFFLVDSVPDETRPLLKWFQRSVRISTLMLDNLQVPHSQWVEREALKLID